MQLKPVCGCAAAWVDSVEKDRRVVGVKQLRYKSDVVDDDLLAGDSRGIAEPRFNGVRFAILKFTNLVDFDSPTSHALTVNSVGIAREVHQCQRFESWQGGGVACKAR